MPVEIELIKAIVMANQPRKVLDNQHIATARAHHAIGGGIPFTGGGGVNAARVPKRQFYLPLWHFVPIFFFLFLLIYSDSKDDSTDVSKNY